MSAASMGTNRSGRPMTSRINWVLLGLVIESPKSYGYRLVKRFEAQFGDLLPLSSNSHIYAALNQLERRGLIEEAGTAWPQSGVARQPRPSYLATAEGRRCYQNWLLAQVDELDHPWLLFVRQLGALGPEPAAALEILERFAEKCMRELRDVSQPERALHAATTAGVLTQEEQRLSVEVKLTWVEFAQRHFEQLAAKGSSR